jgi:hypothetical protein
MTTEEARKILLQQPDATESEHHGHPDFRVANKIFATIWPTENRSVLRLPMEFAESTANDNAERSKVVSRSGSMGWLSIDLEHWKIAEYRPLAELARSQMKSK